MTFATWMLLAEALVYVVAIMLMIEFREPIQARLGVKPALVFFTAFTITGALAATILAIVVSQKG